MAGGWLLAQYSCPVNQSTEMLFTFLASIETAVLITCAQAVQKLRLPLPLYSKSSTKVAGQLPAPISALLWHLEHLVLLTCIERLCAFPWVVNMELSILCQPVVGFSEQVVHQGMGFGLGGEQGPVGLGPYIQKGQVLPHSHQDLCCIVCQGERKVIH